MSQYMYATSLEYGDAASISITNVSKPFFDYFAPEAKLQVGQTYGYNSQQYRQTISSLNGWGDAFMYGIHATEHAFILHTFTDRFSSGERSSTTLLPTAI